MIDRDQYILLENYHRNISLCRFRLAIGLKVSMDDVLVAEETGLPLEIVEELPASATFADIRMINLPDCLEKYIDGCIEKDIASINACEEFNRAMEYYRMIEAVRMRFGDAPSRRELLEVIDEFIRDSEIAGSLACARGYAADMVNMVLLSDCDHAIRHRLLDINEEEDYV